MCYIQIFIYAEFEIINVLLKEKRSKYKPAYALSYEWTHLSSVAIATVAQG